MRIAFVVHKFPPHSLGGTEVYTWSLGRALAAAGHEVNVFYPEPASPQGPRPDLPAPGGLNCSSLDGMQVWTVPLPEDRAHENPVRQYWHTFRDAGIEAAFPRFLAATQPDVVHFQHVQGVSARLISLAAGLPRVATLHDYWYFCANSQLVRPDGTVCDGPGWGWQCADCALSRADLAPLAALRPAVALPFAYRNWYLRRVAREIDRFIAPSEFLRQKYIAQGFPAGRILMLENGLDTSRLAPNGRVDFPPAPGRPHFGFLGSLAWQKGVHVLVDAFNSLPADTGAGLSIYGSDRAFPAYGQQLRARAQHPGIRFAGALDHRNVGAALSRLDCLVVPSLWYENSPLVIQEAYALGVPVVASRLGALAEKVQDGITGRLFAPGDPADLARVLRELIAQPQALPALAAQIRPGPTIEQQAGQLLGIYSSLQQRSRRP